MSKPKKLVLRPHTAIAVLAPPCSGKGTFCRTIASLSGGVMHIETGPLINQRNNSKDIEAIKRGDYVDDEVVLSLVQDKIFDYDPNVHSFSLIDSFPRKKSQVNMFPELLSSDIQDICLVHLLLPDEVVLKRFKGSLEDPERYHRLDNSMETFLNRLRNYRRDEHEVLAEARRFRIPVIKRDISNTVMGAREFHRIHILGQKGTKAPTHRPIHRA